MRSPTLRSPTPGPTASGGATSGAGGAPLLRVDDLVVRFRTHDGTVYAVNGVTFELQAGATIYLPVAVPGALLSVGDGPVLCSGAAAALVGQAPTAAAIRAAADAVNAQIDPPSDIHASARYRRQLARVLTQRALTRAFARAAS